MTDKERSRVVQDAVDAATDQVLEARSAGHLRSVLAYWFELMFDEGRQAKRLPDTLTRLRAMNRRLEERLRESGLPPPPEED